MPFRDVSLRSLEEERGAHRHERFRQAAVRRSVRAIAMAVPDGRDRRRRAGNSTTQWLCRRITAICGCVLAEARQKRDQNPGCEGRSRADMERAGCMGACALVGGGGKQAQGLRDGRQVGLAGGGQGDQRGRCGETGPSPASLRAPGCRGLPRSGSSPSSCAAILKLSWRPAASNRRKVFNGGRRNFICGILHGSISPSLLRSGYRRGEKCVTGR